MCMCMCIPPCQMSEELYHTITTRGGCSTDELLGKTAPAPLSPKCLACLEEMSKQVRAKWT